MVALAIVARVLTPRPRRVIGLAAALAVFAAAGAACGDDDGDGALTIYSGRNEDLIGPLLQTFAEDTGIDIDVKYADSAELALLIDTEGEQSPADVFVSQSPGAMDYLTVKDRLDVLSQDVLDAVPEQFRSSEGEWVGLSGRARTLVYNTDMVSEADLPASVLDLTDPRYEDMVAVAPTNVSFQDFVTAMRQNLGDEATLEYLRGLRDNGAEAYRDNNSIVQAVARGEIAMGLVNHYYNVRAKAEDPSLPTENHFFADGDLGNLILVTGAAKVAGNGHTGEAEEFIGYMLGADAQTYFSEQTKEYPLAAGVEPAEGLPPLESIPAPTEDLSSLGTDLEGTTALIREAGLTGA